MNMKMYRKYNETVLTVNSDVSIFSLSSQQPCSDLAHCARAVLLKETTKKVQGKKLVWEIGYA